MKTALAHFVLLNRLRRVRPASSTQTLFYNLKIVSNFYIFGASFIKTMPRLMKPIKLSNLTEEGFEFQFDANDVKHEESDSEESTVDDLSLKLQQCNKECAGVFDEDVYDEGEPFEVIGKKMFNLVPDGRIKKRIIREGDGEKPNEYAVVKIHYNGYIEYIDEPFDSTYIRKDAMKFVTNSGKVIPGLDFAVQSMKLNEKSQFLIHPDYAYGKNILIGRIPPNATVLFEVELIDVVNCGAAVTYEKLPEQQQKLFSEVYKYCVALMARGKKSYMSHNIKGAIKDYNTAAAKLDKVTIYDKEEIQQHHSLALKLYTNLLICYTRSGEYRKACTNAQKIYDLTDHGELIKIPAKAYFNHAKCLRMLSEYDSAKTVLDKAFKLEPKNPEVADEMLKLEKDRSEHTNKQVIFAKALVGASIN